MAPLLARRYWWPTKGFRRFIWKPRPIATGNPKGTEGLMVNFAKCCSPIPGDPIVGYVSSGRGLVIHTENCRNVEEFRDNPEKVCDPQLG